MAQEENKYLSESGLLKLVEIIKAGFAKITHSHTISEITDYTVDSELSTTSINPVSNQVIKSALDEKVPVTRTVNGKALDADINLTASDLGALEQADLEKIEIEIDTIKNTKANNEHTHTKSEISDFPTIPTKTSELLNDSGFKTTDNNTTYDFLASTNSINGNVNLKLNGSDSVIDSVVIVGTGGTTVTSDSSGIINVNSNKITMKTWSSSDMA